MGCYKQMSAIKEGVIMRLQLQCIIIAEEIHLQKKMRMIKWIIEVGRIHRL